MYVFAVYSDRRGANSFKSFTLLAQPGAGDGVWKFSFAYPQRLIPDAAVIQLLKVTASFLTHSAISPRFAIPSGADNTPNLSILNFPPLMTPPSRDSDKDVERPISPFLLHAAFEGWARSRPEAVALDFGHPWACQWSHW